MQNENIRRLMVEPPHYRDNDEPCWACGAKWESNDPRISTALHMDHSSTCVFMGISNSLRANR